MLVILEAWRHIHKRFKLIYSPLYWGRISVGYVLRRYSSPLRCLQYSRSRWGPRVFAYIGLAAWL